MSLLEENNKAVYCDKCRDKLLDRLEVYKISFIKPSQNFNLLNKGEEFKLCRKCFSGIHSSIEEKIIGGSK